MAMVKTDLARLNFASTDDRLGELVREKFFSVYEEEMGGGHSWVDFYVGARKNLIKAKARKARLRSVIRRKKA